MEVKRIRIKEALKHLEAETGYKVNFKWLAEKVITDKFKPLSKELIPIKQRQILISLYNSGKLVKGNDKKKKGKRRECPDKYLAKIAELTGVTTDYLIGLTDSPTSKK